MAGSMPAATSTQKNAMTEDAVIHLTPSLEMVKLVERIQHHRY